MRKENLGAMTSQETSTSLTWVSQVSEGGLFKPNSAFMDELKKLNKIFEVVHGSEGSLKSGPNFMKTLLELSKKNDFCSEEAKQVFFRCKMYFRIRKLNAGMKSELEKKAQAKKQHFQF